MQAKTSSPACCGTGQVILAACQATNTGAGSSILAASAGAVPKVCAQGCWNRSNFPGQWAGPEPTDQCNPQGHLARHCKLHLAGPAYPAGRLLHREAHRGGGPRSAAATDEAKENRIGAHYEGKGTGWVPRKRAIIGSTRCNIWFVAAPIQYVS